MQHNSTSKLTTVEIVNLRLRAYIGFIDWEKEKLQDLVISYSFKYDSKNATASDDVQYAVDYKKINKQIIAMVDHQSFHLIETVAETIYNFIQSTSPHIQGIEVKVEKPNALRFTDNVLVKISGTDRFNTAMIALGSNIEAEENFTKALGLIQNLGVITKRTEFIITKPLKYEAQADFLNGAILLVTKRSLSELTLQLKQIESLLGRVRNGNKNAPRTIDLDITAFNGFLIDNEIDELPFLKDFLQYLLPEMVNESYPQ